MHIYMFLTRICIQKHVYIAVYGHIYTYMQHLGALEVDKTSSQCIHTQEAGASYTKMTQL